MIMSADGETAWGGKCAVCGKFAEKCQACGGLYLKMWRHLQVRELAPDANDEAKKNHARATACLAGNPAWRAARAVKENCTAIGQIGRAL